MTNGGMQNVRKPREIKNGERYTILRIYSKIYCLYKREVTSSEYLDYMVRPGKGLTNSMDLRIKGPTNKQQEKFAIIDSTKQD